MKKSSLIYAVLFAAFIAASFLAFSDMQRAVGVLLLAVGVASILLARHLATAQNDINSLTDRFIANPWGNARPQLFVIWGIGAAAVGLVLLLPFA